MSLFASMIMAFILSIILTPVIFSVARKCMIYDNPGYRKIHKTKIPSLGGVAIFLSFIMPPLLINADGIILAEYWGLIIAGFIVLGVGIIDDINGLSPGAKFMGQLIAVFLLLIYGLDKPFLIDVFSGPLYLQIVKAVLFALWLTGIMNAINFVDGIDGLASGVSLIALACISIIAFINQTDIVIYASLILMSSMAGFLVYNFPPAKIFMGDCGALFLGLALGYLSVMSLPGNYSISRVFIPVMILTIPIFDTSFAIIRRVLVGKPIYQADKGHIHHRLLERGYSPRKVLAIICCISLAMGILAIILSHLPSLAMVIGVLTSFAVLVLAGIKLKLLTITEQPAAETSNKIDVSFTGKQSIFIDDQAK